MPSSTSRWGLTSPLAADPDDVPADMSKLAVQLDTRMNKGIGAVGVGALGRSDFKVLQRGAGANMSVDVNPGNLIIPVVAGEANQYLNLSAVSNSGAGSANTPRWTATFPAASGANPRIDRVVVQRSLTVVDDFTLAVIPGTATAGATLDNLNGAAAVPAGAVLLADVLIPTSATTITTVNIRDRRPIASRAIVPPLNNVSFDLDMVTFEPCDGLARTMAADVVGAAALQCAALMFLSRRIAGATRIRWRYKQHASTPATGNYSIGIYDASGRKIVDTGTVAFTGGASNDQSRAETIAATDFNAGQYYVAIGYAMSAGDAYIGGVDGRAASAGVVGSGPPGPNMFLASNAGLPLPQTCLGWQDLYVGVASTFPVPIITLSVG